MPFPDVSITGVVIFQSLQITKRTFKSVLDFIFDCIDCQ